MGDIAVSIYCLAFNQSKYIRKTLEGFVMQKTNFRFEVVIHDDASTDGTDLIIKEYADKYSELFVPILQKENQHDKHIPIFRTHIFPIIRGRYIAYCEGDDFWTDPNKLQMQYDIMEKHHECSVAVHCVQGMTEDISKNVRTFPKIQLQEGIIEPEQVMHLMLAQGEWLFQTTSYFVRKDVLAWALKEQPEFYIKPMYGDQALMQICAVRGRFYYIDRIMSVYRMGSSGSMVIRDKAPERRKLKIERSIRALKNFDLETGGRFHDDVEIALKRENFAYAEVSKNYKAMLKPEMRIFLKEIPFYAKLHIFMSAWFPFFDKGYYYIRKKVKGY